MKELIRQYLTDGERAGERYVLAPPRKPVLGTGGSRLGKGLGSSLEFLDHREYQPGDDIRRLDWNAAARSDKLVVKLFREEILPHLDLFIDGSISTNLTGTAKMQATLGMAAIIAQSALNAGFTNRIWLLGDTIRQIRSGPPSLWDMDFTFAGDCGRTFAEFPPTMRPLGIRMLISDLFWQCQPSSILNILSHHCGSVVVVQIVSRTDLYPGISGNHRLKDIETGSELEIYIDPNIIKQYAESVERHRMNWNQSCARAGAQMTTILAEDFVSSLEPSELIKYGVLSFGGPS